MATPLFFIADVGPSREGADTKLNGLDPPLLERPFIASLTHVSVRSARNANPFVVDRVLLWPC